MDKFTDFMPVFPANAGVSDAKRVAFIRQLVANDQAPVEIVPARTGFIDKNTFATHAEILRADGSRTKIAQFAPQAGNPSPFRGAPGKHARCSRTSQTVNRRTIALQFKEGGRIKLGILDSALRDILPSDRARRILLAGLTKARLVAGGHGHAGTIQKRIPIERGGRIITKPRLWKIDLDKLRAHVSTNRMCSRPQPRVLA